MDSQVDVQFPVSSPKRPELEEVYEEGDDLMCELIMKIVERASQYLVIKRHIIYDLKAMDIRHVGIKVLIDKGLFHPS